jgi:UDP-glucose:(heptosyl)LPS alpha-1,3-glucosyltransferase
MVRRQMIQYHKIPEDRIRLVYNGVDVDRFRPPDSADLIQARQRLRSELGFTDEVVYLLVSHDFDLKGLWTVMRSLRGMLADGRKAALVVVGSGTMKGKKIWGVPIGRAIDRYLRLARRWGCDRAVRFVGLQDDPVPFFQAADVYVQPTLYDACSLVVLEAMSCGLPAITSQYNGVSELIQNDVEGHVVDDPQDVKCVTQQMCSFLDASRRREAGFAARRLAEHHSATVNFEQIMEVYKDVLARRAAAAPARPHRAAAELPT